MVSEVGKPLHFFVSQPDNSQAHSSLDQANQFKQAKYSIQNFSITISTNSPSKTTKKQSG